MQITLKAINLLKKIVAVGLFISISPLFAQTASETIEYKVKANDTLIKILKKHQIKPIYGNSGALATALKLNPKKQIHQGNLIFVGEVLLIPKHLILSKNNQSHTIKEKKKNENALSIKQENSEKKAIQKTKQESTKKKEEPQFQTINPFELEKPQKTEIFQPSKEYQPLKSNAFVSETVEANKIESSPPTANNNKDKSPISDNTRGATPIFELKEQFLLDYGNYCTPDPMCSIWLWNLNNRCCNIQQSPLVIHTEIGI